MTRIFHWFFMWKMDPMPGCDISVLCLLFSPETVHCSTKNAYTSEITITLWLLVTNFWNQINQDMKVLWLSFLIHTFLYPGSKNYNVKIVLSEVQAFLVLRCTVPGRQSKHKTDSWHVIHFHKNSLWIFWS